jgi:hypothetical protein
VTITLDAPTTLTPAGAAGFQVGDRPRITAKFVCAETAAPVDPDVVRFRYKRPDGSQVTLVHGIDAALVRDGVGVYYVDLLLDVPCGVYDEWTVRFESAGNLSTAAKRPIQVKASAFS